MATIMLKVSPITIGPNSSRLHNHMAQNILFEILLVKFWNWKVQVSYSVVDDPKAGLIVCG
jgi:hypothetical protein